MASQATRDGIDERRMRFLHGRWHGLRVRDADTLPRMTSKQFRAHALSLPEASEAPHFDRASFRIGKKIFATLTADGAEAMVRVSPRQRLYALLKEQPEVFFSYGGWTERNGSLGVRLGRAEVQLICELITDSWRLIAPKRALALVARH